MDSGELARRSQKHGIKDLLAGMMRSVKSESSKSKSASFSEDCMD
jgi:hypothetical protein